MNEVNGFVFYSSYADAIRSLPSRSQLKALWAIIDKGLYDKDTELDGTAAGMYALIVPNLVANRKRYAQNAANGKKGGRPKKNAEPEPEEDDEEDPDFEAFWKTYPRKVNKQAAKGAWDKLLLTHEDIAKISATLEKAKEKDPRFKELRFTPFPAKWLENREWQNEYRDTQDGSFNTDEFFEAALANVYGKDVS